MGKNITKISKNAIICANKSKNIDKVRKFESGSTTAQLQHLEALPILKNWF